MGIVTDGNWHRIGFVWEGLYRTLYVDDVIVAQDTQDGLEGSSNGVHRHRQSYGTRQFRADGVVGYFGKKQSARNTQRADSLRQQAR